jgi:hypothetical protein
MTKLTFHISFEDLKTTNNTIRPDKRDSVEELELVELVKLFKNNLRPREYSEANDLSNQTFDGK